MKFYKGLITKLEPNQVFVFGSNLGGFHGAGAAGYASFGIPGNHWRDFDYGSKPKGWKGLWNTKGIGEGYQEGTIGRSYAFPTVIDLPGRKMATLDQIRGAVERLYTFAKKHKDLDFMVAYTYPSYSLCGHSIPDIISCFAAYPIPENMVFSESVRQLLAVRVPLT